MSEPTHLYRWYDADDALLYVGISSSLSDRTQQHLKGSRWTRWATQMHVGDEYPTREEALVAESAAIVAEAPVFNVIGAIDPWGRINAYLIKRGESPIVPPSRKTQQTSRSEAGIGRRPLDPEHPLASQLTEIREAVDEILLDAETSPDPWEAAKAAGELVNALLSIADAASLVRARIILAAYEAGGISYAKIGARLGLTTMRIHQIATAAKRQRDIENAA